MLLDLEQLESSRNAPYLPDAHQGPMGEETHALSREMLRRDEGDDS